jgi:hypothetical protein
LSFDYNKVASLTKGIRILSILGWKTKSDMSEKIMLETQDNSIWFDWEMCKEHSSDLGTARTASSSVYFFDLHACGGESWSCD